MARRRPRCIGLALGSGASRGWAHIGVVRELLAAGIRPQVVCGSSIGAVVGAAYAAGVLDPYEEWVRQLDRRKVIGYFDLALRGGLIKGQRVFEFMRSHLPGQMIEALPMPFAAVATDLSTGEEVWLRSGMLFDALRASGAVPGMVTPVVLDGRLLVDGGIVNPVPVSLCRALGADFVIAVDLNTMLLPRQFRGHADAAAARDATALRDAMGAREAAASREAVADSKAEDIELRSEDEAVPVNEYRLQALARSLSADLQQMWRRRAKDAAPRAPSIFEVIGTSFDIMQVRITRSRMAGDPPEMLVTPCLPDFSMLDFDRAEEAIAEGRRAGQHALASTLPGLDL